MPKVKNKERILKAAGEKQMITYNWVPIRLSADFSKETLQTRRGWQEIFKVMKSKDLQPRLLYPTKLSFRMEGLLYKCFPRQVIAKGVHHHQAIITWNVKGTYLRKRRSKLWIIKWQQIHNYQQLNLKTKTNKQAKNNQANNQDRNRIIDMEIIWRVIIWEREGGEWGKMCRD